MRPFPGQVSWIREGCMNIKDRYDELWVFILASTSDDNVYSSE